ncbi:hypothetical protein QFC20_007439 [Naganishia adeliensis]|uniref:Uncharacterized protein n=1 Tax=Naganishia adeliensis TaxID=92952 RepID=A0ACC2UZN3_9TREE|nr:hypothetical protein QFC20_007439 [Naganishia adeliensis]
MKAFTIAALALPLSFAITPVHGNDFRYNETEESGSLAYTGGNFGPNNESASLASNGEALQWPFLFPPSQTLNTGSQACPSGYLGARDAMLVLAKKGLYKAVMIKQDGEMMEDDAALNLIGISHFCFKMPFADWDSKVLIREVIKIAVEKLSKQESFHFTQKEDIPEGATFDEIWLALNDHGYVMVADPIPRAV